jgi:Uma2 family endonuclease
MSSAYLVTAEELERRPEDDYRYELVEGRLIRMSPVGYQHGAVVARLMFLLMRHLESTHQGYVATEVGFKLASTPDTVRAPDVSFVRSSRIPSPTPRGFFHGPPDIAFEVLSPDDRPADVRTKVDEYLSRGVRLVVVVDPDNQSVTCRRAGLAPVTGRTPEDVLDLDDLMPGFKCQLRDLFE